MYKGHGSDLDGLTTRVTLYITLRLLGGRYKGFLQDMTFVICNGLVVQTRVSLCQEGNSLKVYSYLALYGLTSRSLTNL